MINISCTAEGVPAPTITWTLRGTMVPFEQTDVSTEPLAGEGEAIIPAQMISTLHIVNGQYFAHEGVYTCQASYKGMDLTRSDAVTVDFLGT